MNPRPACSPSRRTPLRTLLLLLVAASLPAAEEKSPDHPLWLRYPALSPDGTTLAFTYGGQLWRVPATGGDAVALTAADVYSTRPVWSPDGQRLAYAAKAHGNLDVFTVPAAGGESTRLTFHSSDDQPYAFSPDGKRIYFASPRLGSAQTIHAGTYVHSDQLYTVPVAGGRARLVLPTPALSVSPDATGQSFLYENRPIYENDWRKGSVSDGAHDIWLYDLRQKSHRRLTDFRGEDRNPVWAPDGSGYYFLSERSGSFNIWKAGLAAGATPVQVTHHTGAAVRFVSVARNGTLAYGLEGEIWTQAGDHATARRVAIRIRSGALAQAPAKISANEHLTEMALSRDARQIAVMARGEVFVLSTDTGRTRRITTTPGHERHVSFAPDGRSLVYISERDGDMDIFEARLGDAAMKSFTDSGPIVETKLIDTAGDLQYPKISPDGKRLAYLADRNRILVFDRATGATATALPPGNLYSYVDEDVSFDWSPDSRWLTAAAGSIVTKQDIVLLDATGRNAPVFVSNSGFSDQQPSFSPDGQAVLWASSREGLRQADSSESQFDLYRASLNHAAFDATRRKSATAAPTPPADWQPEVAGIARRTERLTSFSISPLFYTLTPDNRDLIFVRRTDTGKTVGHRLTLASGELTDIFSRPAADAYAADPTAQNLYLLEGGTVVKLNLATGETKTLPLDTTMDVDPRGEMNYWFNHLWRLTKFKFYEPTMHGRDWDAVKARYARFLPHIDTWEDFAEAMAEMAGELNASHMGCYFLKPAALPDSTASLGLHFDDDYPGPGLRVAAVLPGGPADLSGSKLAPGATILALDGRTFTADTNLDQLLNGLARNPVKLTVQPADGSALVTETIEPIALDEALALSYERWVDERKALTARLSGGRLGYVHIPAMDVESYKRVYSEAMGEYRDKAGLLVDVRYNMGGNLHDQLITLFTGEATAGFTSRRGELVGRIPTGRWAKPTALVQNAAAYSDGSIFPHLYRRQNLGPIIGTRVPGTGTAVWWMYPMKGALKWGVPQLGAKDFKTGWFENQETTPDLLVADDPAALAAGRDPQLEAAIAALLRKIATPPLPPTTP